MDKSNLELFKQALSDGLSERFDSVVDSYTEEIVCSERHKLAVKTIIYGKAETKRALSPKAKRIIVILVAAALLLTSCGIIFRNEIHEFVEEFFVKLTYSGNEGGSPVIEEVYELTYLPEGYTLIEKKERPIRIQWKYTNENNDMIKFEQRVCEETSFTINSEDGYSKFLEVDCYDVYYRYTEEYHSFYWLDDKYAFSIRTNDILSNEEIELIIKGLK